MSNIRETISKIIKEQIDSDRIMRMGKLSKSTFMKYTNKGYTLYTFDDSKMSLVKVKIPSSEGGFDSTTAGKVVFALTDKEFEASNKIIDKVKEIIELEERKIKIFKNEYVPAAIAEIIKKNDN